MDPSTAAAVSAVAAILSALAAVVSASIAAVTVYYQRQTLRPNVRVELKGAFPFYDTPRGRELGQTVMTIEAMNRGVVPVVLTSAGFGMQDGRTMIPELHTFDGSQPLGRRLEPGEGASIVVDIREVAIGHLREGGVKDAFVKTAAGDRFSTAVKSGWIESWAKHAASSG